MIVNGIKMVTLLELIIFLFFIILIFLYMVAIRKSNLTYKRWPHHRVICWILGVLCVAISVIGPIAHMAHHHFVWHMIGHLLLGMLAPVLLVLSAPTTLLLRLLPVWQARRLTRVLRSKITRIYTNPLVATTLNIGGLWVLYTTDLYVTMLENSILQILIHVHIFLAGYLFTVSLLYIDPVPYRVSYLYRTTVFVIALAAHEILSKYIYANPPAGVEESQAKIGGMLMYYGGDAIDLIIIVVLFYQWYKSTKPINGSTFSRLTS